MEGACLDEMKINVYSYDDAMETKFKLYNSVNRYLV